MKFIGYSFILISSLILQGVLVMKLWMWFIKSVFETLPTLTLGQSVGIAFVISIVKNNISDNQNEIKKDVDEWVVENWITRVLYIGFSLLIGWGIYCAIV